MLLLLTIQPSVEKLLWESCRTFSKCRVMPPWNSASESAPVSRRCSKVDLWFSLFLDTVRKWNYS